MIDLVSRFSIRRQPGSLVYLFMLESGAADYHVSGPGEVDQPLSVTGCFVVQAEFSDCGTKNSLLAHPGVEVAKHDFYVVAGAALIGTFQALIEGIFGRIVLLFRRGVGAN